MDSFKRFSEEKLLNKKCFYSSVKDGTTGNNGKKSRSLFQKFIDTCLKFCRLDPCHYFSSPGLSWDAMLKMTDEKLQKIFDIDMYLFIEKGLRRGIFYIAKRYTKTNNKCMKNYNPKKASKFITYLI